MAGEDIIKTYPVVPGGNVQLEDMPTQLRDATMGRYMDAFSRLEGMVQLAIGLMMQIDLTMLRSVFAVLMAKQSIDLLDATARIHLTRNGAERAHRICERLGRRNMRRNHIVHGSWSIMVIASDTCVTQEWVRSYAHVDPAVQSLQHTDPKVAGIYTFTVPELARATDHVEEMVLAVSALIGDLPSLRPPLPTPEEQLGV